jgi:hypothetical protein
VKVYLKDGFRAYKILYGLLKGTRKGSGMLYSWLLGRLLGLARF